MPETTPEPAPSGSSFSPRGLPSEDERLGYQPDPVHVLKQREATTARNLAYILVTMLFLSVMGQYALVAIFVWHGRGDATANFDHIFNAWLPVIAGLASSAVTYYLTKERK